MSALAAGVIRAWQAALAAEHRAVYGYALLGPRLDSDDRLRAQSDYDAHQDVRDATSAAIAAAGQTPVGPAADYPALYPVDDASAARRLALVLEQSATAAWRFLFAAAASAATDTELRAVRTSAQRYLTASAVRAALWRETLDPSRATVPFPGL